MSMVIKLLCAVLALLAGFYASDLMQHFSSEAKQQNQHYCPVTSKPCQQQGVTMRLTQDTVQPLISTTLMVDWPTSQTQQLTLTLQGLEMEMGTVKFLLTRSTGHSFSGQLMLPVCTMQNMTWIGTLTDGETTVYLSVRMEK
ncbi:hypothetical protein CAG54_13440 [Vibrio sp. V27_P1S3P104]|uniref:hypothetical protein n=1 Tax=unclassified Vibrio TaxID=2614977 RepID=UPI001372B1FB|nr:MULTISPECIES: hypothetical protein [unclassified Vibrio]NAW69886.1 hypothetical protein [Vibrio sp. V28_P6S34P95]NAX03930.1 hypothetical protein [Vibrio sp. V30_P3S12P165]NAX35094.1 hypothetical protein [Vibrio sp. V29_P1S30P107]NAX38504.1 hypothetical protein [Vibrio sp. V27_P1S3P104]NAX41060.1 hypothetical protein [Vibrio sp. V26_P1S5P106]